MLTLTKFDKQRQQGVSSIWKKTKKKKPDETEGQKPEETTPTPSEEKGGMKKKIAAFFAVKRNKIIVGVSAVAVVALVVGLSVGLSRCGSGHVHKVTTGVLNLNGDKAQIEGICSECSKKASADLTNEATFTSVYYGYYPQTHVADTATITALDALTAESNGWYLLNGTYYAKADADAYYYEDEFEDGTNIYKSAYHWFTVDPIEWRVLSSKDGKHSLVSKLLLDTQVYDDVDISSDDDAGNNYKNSKIRTWLTGEFLNKAFTKGSSYLVETSVDNSAATTDSATNKYACENTNDKVYLLSYQDYSNTAYFADASARQCKTSDWARNKHGACNREADYAGTYWTRSPHSSMHNRVSYINGNDGNELTDEDYTRDYISVRPGITISIA